MPLGVLTHNLLTEIMLQKDDDFLKAPPMQASDEECAENMIPHFLRDNCAHLLIPLEKCRKQTAYMPWACGKQRHAYEACQYRE